MVTHFSTFLNFAPKDVLDSLEKVLADSVDWHTVSRQRLVVHLSDEFLSLAFRLATEKIKVCIAPYLPLGHDEIFNVCAVLRGKGLLVRFPDVYIKVKDAVQV